LATEEVNCKLVPVTAHSHLISFPNYTNVWSHGYEGLQCNMTDTTMLFV